MKTTLETTKCLCFDDSMEALSIKYRKFSTTESIIMHDGEENSAFLCLFYWMIQITLLKENLTFLTKRFSIRQILVFQGFYMSDKACE
jgi:hypothetical protein